MRMTRQRYDWASRIFLTISTARISAVCFTGYNLSRRIDRQGLIATFYIDGVKQPNLVEPDDVPEVPLTKTSTFAIVASAI